MSQAQIVLSNLTALLNTIREYEDAKAEVTAAQRALQSSNSFPSHLKSFDDDHLEQFVTDKIGHQPVEPDGIIKLLFPVYLIQKSQYDAANATYMKMRPIAEAAYRENYRAERETLRLQDEKEIAQFMETAKQKLDAAKERLSIISAKVEEDKTVSTSLKKSVIVTKLISYLEENRADDLKEAVNLYYDELRKDEEAKKAEAHRQAIKALEEEKVRAIQEAAEYQRLQYEEAQHAAYYAQQAAEAAQNAADAAKGAHSYGDI